MVEPVSAPEVVALGDVNVDVIAQIAHYPAKGEDAFSRSTTFHCGGSAANTATVLSCLGVRVALVARVGSDPWASVARRALEQAGVLLDCLQVDDEAMTGLMVILVTPDGERTMIGDRGANALAIVDETHQMSIRRARLLHLSGYALLEDPQRSAALRAVEVARSQHVAISLDPGFAVSTEALDQMRSLLPAVDLLLPNLAEAKRLTHLSSPDDCVRALLGLGVGTVALKLGRSGCLVATNEHTIRMPAFSVKARDSTGAGDSFAAGLIAAMLGRIDWEGGAVLGNALGAATTAHAGAGPRDTIVGDALALLRDANSSCARAGFRDALARAAGFLESVSPKDILLTKQTREANQ